MLDERWIELKLFLKKRLSRIEDAWESGAAFWSWEIYATNKEIVSEVLEKMEQLERR